MPVVTRGHPRCTKCQADLPGLVDATESDFAQVIDTSTIPLLVDLWAEWCGPCRAVAPVLEQLAVERAGSLRIVKVNVDAEPAVSARLGVQSIPTMVLYDSGAEVARQIGALPADRIRQWIDSSLVAKGTSPN